MNKEKIDRIITYLVNALQKNGVDYDEARLITQDFLEQLTDNN